jgi:hypothetical protein
MVKIVKWRNFYLYSNLYSPANSSFLGPHIFLSILFSDNFNLYEIWGSHGSEY